jgi:hypothetical protein
VGRFSNTGIESDSAPVSVPPISTDRSFDDSDIGTSTTVGRVGAEMSSPGVRATKAPSACRASSDIVPSKICGASCSTSRLIACKSVSPQIDLPCGFCSRRLDLISTTKSRRGLIGRSPFLKEAWHASHVRALNKAQRSNAMTVSSDTKAFFKLRIFLAKLFS